jgi:hypothetical protein
VKATYLFIWIALCFAACGYTFLALGEKQGYYGVMGIFGTLWGIIAFCSAIRDAGYFKGIHHTPAE